MQHSDAIKLINHQSGSKPETWADLGAGSGTFTLALAELLPEKSKIYALDQDKRALARISSAYLGIRIQKVNEDFERTQFPEKLDGILMANSLHYVKDKPKLLQHYKTFFRSDPKWLIVEYDTHTSNPWIPYPITPGKLKELFNNEAYNSFDVLGEYASVYGRKMYGMKIE